MRRPPRGNVFLLFSVCRGTSELHRPWSRRLIKPGTSSAPPATLFGRKPQLLKSKGGRRLFNWVTQRVTTAFPWRGNRQARVENTDLMSNTTWFRGRENTWGDVGVCVWGKQQRKAGREIHYQRETGHFQVKQQECGYEVLLSCAVHIIYFSNAQDKLCPRGLFKAEYSQTVQTQQRVGGTSCFRQ